MVPLAFTVADWAVGCSVRLLTTLDEVVEGTVFAFDRLSNCLTLTQEGTIPGTLDFRLLKASCVKSILSASQPDTEVDFSLPYIDLHPSATNTSLEAITPEPYVRHRMRPNAFP